VKTEELSQKCPKCGCKDKHILQKDSLAGILTGIKYKNSGSKVPKGSNFRCTECGYIFK
jgi:predicted RNA-binding Zn-ribbon protein involved in translation (DUF1610 family)